MQFEVESTRVADGFALRVATPQCRRRRTAVGANQSGSTVAVAI